MLRVTSTGSKSFSVAKKIDDKYVRVTLRRFSANSIEQARKKARENILLMENGVYPIEKKRQERIQRSLEHFNRTWKLHVNLELENTKPKM